MTRLALALAIAGLAGCNKAEPPAEKAPAPEKAAAEKAAPTADKAPPAAEKAEPDARAAFEARAQAATGTLKKSLMGALQGAMKDGGPAAAVTACNTQAPEIAKAAATADVKVGRASAKLRNPGNAPAPWLEPLLAEYAAVPAAEAKPKVVELEGGGFGYVEPLYVGGVCLTCHGDPTGIPQEVKTQLATLYPKDAATGYAAGDFRGLVWATGK